MSQATNTVLSTEEYAKRLNVAMYTSAPAGSEAIEENADGTGIVRGVRVFKAGTFKDSIGEQRTWTAEHLAMMVANYEMLRAGGQFPDVPQRQDHWSGVGGLVGYFDGLSTDGAFLYADLKFTEPDALAKFKRGTYRGRSLEVGFFETNAETLHWPVVQGVAWVDIPAVEGLTAKYAASGAKPYTVISDKEITSQMGTPAETAPAVFKIKGADTSDYAAVQAHVTGLETANAELVAANLVLTTSAHEQAIASRSAFVASLASSNKIAQPQVASLTELVTDMTEAQYVKFTASYEGAPVLSILGQHGDGVTNPDGSGNAATSEIDTAKAVVANHRRTNMTPAQLALTPSYRKLVAAGIEK